MILSESVKKLAEISSKTGTEALANGEDDTINVDDVAARVASFYEAIRGIVDWREEHLLRKTAIERILKRRALLQGDMTGEDGIDASEQFLRELIRGGHFPNYSIPLEKIEEIRQVLNKYAYFLKNSGNGERRKREELTKWLIQMASYEVEITLDPHEKELGLVDFTTKDLLERVKLRAEDKKFITEDEKNLQIYVAVHRVLFKMDDPVIAYHLLGRLYLDWHNPTESTLHHVANHIWEIKELIEKTLGSPYGEIFYRLVERRDTPYLILGDIIYNNVGLLGKVSENSDELDVETNKAYKVRLNKLKGRIRRAAIYSTISIFLSKVFIALLLEIPLDSYIQGHINTTAIMTSVLIPPILMLFLITNIKLTSDKNVISVKKEVRALFTGEDKIDYYITFPKIRRYLNKFIFASFYLLSFAISYGLVAWLLLTHGFGPFSVLIFLFFVSLVAFAGTKIQQRGSELIVGEVKSGFIGGIIDFFFLPVIQVGKWLSKQLVRYNAIVFILNFLIETPIQVFLEFFEQWRNFLRDKKEEIH